MVKVIINKCFGGFGLSHDAMKWLIEKKKWTIEKHNIKENHKCMLIDYRDSQFNSLGIALNEEVIAPTNKDDDWTKSIQLIRTHKDIIECVETLGSIANGSFAELKIVEIPDDIEWEIDEYDGIESIHEKHEVWG
jgi:hypothetical protein